MADYCCDRMRYDFEQACDVHSDRRDCPDALIGRAFGGGFGIYVRDGGTSLIMIAYCPWCGTHLPDED